jgi:uncharacterized Zn finger protein (UPF0148 family)
MTISADVSYQGKMHHAEMHDCGSVMPYNSKDLVCPNCGSTDLRQARHDGQPLCACCGSDNFQPIMRSVFVANELREAAK